MAVLLSRKFVAVTARGVFRPDGGDTCGGVCGVMGMEGWGGGQSTHCKAELGRTVPHWLSNSKAQRSPNDPIPVSAPVFGQMPKHCLTQAVQTGVVRKP